MERSYTTSQKATSIINYLRKSLLNFGLPNSLELNILKDIIKSKLLRVHMTVSSYYFEQIPLSSNLLDVLVFTPLETIGP